ncbi:TetR family transcriptional regulator [Stackebrandtia albiflava]|uniref:TetR family transcriptional regulator n=1 Tax=Stackebrandtia albiflava TaxID=406432 RepID=A0A562VG64_9ACTN|nr:TetR/AcrR family transcriptional regulator [Stackebrandtia albiflava]TWJ16903.1 TetR family transcriptional regulator [Stackebrandtia albiflava]
MNAPKTARERARATITADIIATARRHLADVGAADLSLRAIARDLGMASSAVYRYVAGRDELLTALLLDAFNELGTVVEHAPRPEASPLDNWTAVWLHARQWALDHRHEFALLYGTPVPGYHAPADTVTAASRLPLTLAKILNDAADTGRLTDPATPLPDFDLTMIEPEIVALITLRVRDARLAALLSAWTLLIGTIGFELFGHHTGVVTRHEDYLRHTARVTGTGLGLPAT